MHINAPLPDGIGPQGSFDFANIKTKSESPITPPHFSRSLTIFLYKRQCNRDCFLSETVKLPEPTPILLYAFFDRKTLQPFICYAICLFLRRLPLNSWACKPFSNEGFVYNRCFIYIFGCARHSPFQAPLSAR